MARRDLWADLRVHLLHQLGDLVCINTLSLIDVEKVFVLVDEDLVADRFHFGLELGVYELATL